MDWEIKEVQDERTIIAYRVSDWQSGMRIVPAPRHRGWMDATPHRFANRCLPLMIANQWGWQLLCPHKITLEWKGDGGIKGVSVSPAVDWCASHFGCGIFTFRLPFLFRTPPGISLMATGPINHIRDGVAPLTGIIETSWLTASFTYNWVFTRPTKTTFNEGDPICQLCPVPSAFPEKFRPIMKNLSENPKLEAEWTRWRTERQAFIDSLGVRGSHANKKQWQGDYYRGDGAPDGEHRVKLDVREFMEDRNENS